MRRGEAEKESGGDNTSFLQSSPENSASPPTGVFVSEIEWPQVKRVLVIRLRSIGDTVLATPSFTALRRFLPDAKIDVLLEDWVAPLLEGFDRVDNVITVGNSASERLRTAFSLRRNRYDIVFNLHGGTTSTFFARATGARHRIGFANYQYSFLYNHLLSSSSDFWGREHTHSAEQQLALLGFVGVPVSENLKTSLHVTENAEMTVNARLANSAIGDPLSAFALIHPAAAFATKQWAAANFARVAEYLKGLGIRSVAVAAKDEQAVLDKFSASASVPVVIFDDLSLPEITALASKARLFVGNDSGIAHIAAAVGTPSVVIFGSSNRNHWRPWTSAAHETVYEEFPCQPCPGYECKQFGEPKCILSVSVDSVISALERVIQAENSRNSVFML